MNKPEPWGYIVTEAGVTEHSNAMTQRGTP